MTSFLETYGFKKSLNLTINKEKFEFIKFLEQKTKPNRLFFFDMFDSEQIVFYGTVSSENFWLRKKNKSLFPESPFANAEGIIKSSSNQTELEVKIIGWNWFSNLWLAVMTLVFGLTLSDILRTEFYGVLIIFIPIFLILYTSGIYEMRKGVKKLEHYLITELR